MIPADRASSWAAATAGLPGAVPSGAPRQLGIADPRLIGGWVGARPEHDGYEGYCQRGNDHAPEGSRRDQPPRSVLRSTVFGPSLGHCERSHSLRSWRWVWVPRFEVVDRRTVGVQARKRRMIRERGRRDRHGKVGAGRAGRLGRFIVLSRSVRIGLRAFRKKRLRHARNREHMVAVPAPRSLPFLTCRHSEGVAALGTSDSDHGVIGGSRRPRCLDTFARRARRR